MSLHVFTNTGTTYTIKAASYATLTTIFRRSALIRQEDGRAVGGWLGSSPRVTRLGGNSEAVLHPLSNVFQTYVCWVYELPDNLSEADRQRALAMLKTKLDEAIVEGTARSWWQYGADMTWVGFEVANYSEAVNGPVDFWRSGRAADTSTRDDFPVRSYDAPQNPIGPDSRSLHPTTVGDVIIEGVTQPSGNGGAPPLLAAMQALAWVVVPVTAALVLFVYVPPRVMPWNWAVFNGQPGPRSLNAPRQT